MIWSPHNSPSSSVLQLFPPKCIFCGRHEVKVLGNTDVCITFPIFKDKNRALKEHTWKQIEPCAQDTAKSTNFAIDTEQIIWLLLI